MAHSDKNVIITPNVGSSTDDPKIIFSGADASASAQNITIKAYPTSNGTLSIEGSAGQLFSVTNSMSGSIFSVNDVSGIPSIEVLDSGLIKFGQYSGNVLLGTGTDSGFKLDVNGTARFVGAVTTSSGGSRFGNLLVGNGTYKNSITPISDTNLNLDTPSGSVYVTTNIRAPIFYDVDNTAYYADPNSTSNLYGLTVNQTITGSVSGNSGTVGGLSVHAGRNNEVNKVVRTDASGYIQAGWINTDSGDNGVANRLTRIYSSYDNYVRYSTLTDFKVHMGLSAKNNYSRRIDYTSDSNYWVGSMGQNGTGANEVFHGGSGFFDIWSGTNYPSGTSHIHGFNALHYTTNSYGSTGGAAYGLQFASQYGQDGIAFIRSCNNGTFTAWRRFMTEDIWHNSKYFGSDGIIYAGASSRSPIFYDYDDTGYYVNPNGFSEATYLRLRGGWGVSGVHQEQLTVRGSFASMCLRATNGNQTYWLIHNDASSSINFYGGTGGADGTSWNNNFYIDQSGNATARGNVTAYSDVRLKTNIKPIKDSITKIKKLRGVTFNWISDNKPSIGLIAQEVEEILPELVVTGINVYPGTEIREEVKSVDYGKIVSICIEAIKEQQTQLEQQQETMNKLKLLLNLE